MKDSKEQTLENPKKPLSKKEKDSITLEETSTSTLERSRLKGKKPANNI